ncbi:MAG: glycosyltransferase [Planctomycetota bacterium]
MTPGTAPQSRIAVIAIGRNEGQRLVDCLRSALDSGADHVVYVDSGSTDGSVDTARQLGVEVVELDLSTPFTAARARNEGVARLIEQQPETAFIQMIDGDCTLDHGWLDTAAAALIADPKLAVVCGRRRERFPDAAVYNRLADMEWDTPIGPARSCGGDALFRVEAFQQAGGYNPSVIAGEEPELCVRLRRAGWLIERLDAEMTLHDADMTRFSQWWKRNVRAGHAYAQGAHMHGKTDGHNVKQVRSIAFWGILIPLVIVGTAVLSLVFGTLGLALLATICSGLGTLLALGYPVLFLKVARYRTTRGDAFKPSLAYGFFTVLGKFANAQGLLHYHRNRLGNQPAQIIEYKAPAASEAAA